ncbi:MAG TPA: glycosyltransferase family 4 protein [Candidatus Hydrogenedentes bacterium]|nr:glycosyltransferase family 4 protein [Candidatus Hydrogenedentota bacterium]
MKICILSVLHEPYDKRVYQKVARSLHAAGHEVVSICPSDAPLPDEAGGIRFVRIPTPPSKRRRLIALARLVRLGRRERADAYLAVEPESWVAALILKGVAGGKVVFDMHEHVPTEFAKFFPRFLQPFVTWLTIRFMRLFARCTDHVILTRDSFEAEWAGLTVPRTTIINTNHLQPPCADIPEELRARYADRPTIIHQGVFGDVRGAYQLLDAMKRIAREVPDIKCVLLGGYVYGSLDDYRGAIREAGLDAHFDILGVVPYEAVPAHIAVSRVGLILFQPGLVNHTLAMPHKLFDYLREGKPVVAPDFAVEVARIVREADAGLLVDVTRPEAIADAVLRLLRDPAEAARLGGNGRRIVETKYNWEREEARLRDVFTAL